MRKLISGILILSVTLFASAVVSARTTATVNKTQITQNEVFQLTISTDQDADRDSVSFDKLKNQFMVSQPSFGHSINIINGSRTNKSEWTVTLATSKLGVVTIPSFSINGEKTQPIALQVVRDQSSPRTSDLVEFQTHIEKRTLYPNESTLMHVKLFIKADIQQMQNPQITPPSANGVNLEPASKPMQTQQVINGINTTVLTQSFRITATSPGNYTVREPKFQSSMYYRDYRGNTKIVPLITTPDIFNIQVLAKPKQFHGTWLPTSSLTLSEQWLNSQNVSVPENKPITLNVGDSLTRLIHLTVRGVAQERVPDITLTYPEALRVYPEKPKYKNLANGDLEMTLKQVIIASKPGKYSLPGVTINWWDTATKKQRKSFLPAKILTVKGSAASAPIAQSVMPTPPATVETESKPKVEIINNAGYWPYLTALFALLWLATLSLFIFTHRKTKPVDEKQEPQNEMPSTINSLRAAIKEKDGINIQRYYALWKAEQHHIGDNVIELDQAVSALLSQLYSQNSDGYQPESVLGLLKKTNGKVNKSKKQKTFHFPKM
ncbi:BatD family protein [Vibrio salinus]|uniref:BatD family protein n=1 Tax=Vibrio salinus TaxID=2899784 RepID=UPI001E5E408D|nr:BatD family protein [Vibrio salinus]MCE0495244.1 BatD family protein [Vibrio salinus]